MLSNKKKLLYSLGSNFILTIFIITFYSCEQNAEYKPNYGMRTITNFQVLPENNPRNIFIGHMGIIDENKKTITISLPKSADLTRIKPTIRLAPFASVSPSSLAEVDLTDTVEYVVTAQNGRKAYYSVTAKNDYLYSGATLMFLELKNILNEADEPIRIRFDRNTMSYVVPEGKELNNIQLELIPDPYSHNASYYINNNKTDLSEPIDFTHYSSGLKIMVISENMKNFSVYTLNITKQ